MIYFQGECRYRRTEYMEESSSFCMTYPQGGCSYRRRKCNVGGVFITNDPPASATGSGAGAAAAAGAASGVTGTGARTMSGKKNWSSRLADAGEQGLTLVHFPAQPQPVCH